jgi:hypothetical protein
METIYHLNRYLVDCIGAPHAQLNQPWVKYLCTFNGVLALLQYIRQTAEKSKFPTPKGERKIAAFNVMNDKYVGYLKWTLFAHILGGMTSQLGSSLAILLENYSPQWSKRLAKISSAAETFVHAPTAFVLTPFVYGDPGVVPYLYGTVSFLLQVSGLSALEESWREEKPQQEMSTAGKSEKSSLEMRIPLRGEESFMTLHLSHQALMLMLGPFEKSRKSRYIFSSLACNPYSRPKLSSP